MHEWQRETLAVSLALLFVVTLTPRAASAQGCNETGSTDPLQRLQTQLVFPYGPPPDPSPPPPWAPRTDILNDQFIRLINTFSDDGGPPAGLINGPLTIANRHTAEWEDVRDSVAWIAFIAAHGPDDFRDAAIDALFLIGHALHGNAYGRRALAHGALLWLAEHGDLPDAVANGILTRLSVAQMNSPLNPTGLPSAMISLPGIRVENGVVIAQGAVGQATLSALQANGGVSLGGVFEDNNFNLGVDANGQLVLVGLDGETHPLEVLGVNAQANGSAAVLIRATGTAGIQIGGDSRSTLGVSANLFAGASANGSVSVTLPLFVFDVEISAGGQAQFGIGGTAEANIGWEPGTNGHWELETNAGLSLAVGPGAGLNLGFTLSPGALFSAPSGDPIPALPSYYTTLNGDPIP